MAAAGVSCKKQGSQILGIVLVIFRAIRAAGMAV